MTHYSLVQAMNNIRNDCLLFFSVCFGVVCLTGAECRLANSMCVSRERMGIATGQDLLDVFLSARLRDTSGNFPRAFCFPQREEHKVTAFVLYTNGDCQGDSIPLRSFIVSLTSHSKY